MHSPKGLVSSSAVHESFSFTPSHATITGVVSDEFDDIEPIFGAVHAAHATCPTVSKLSNETVIEKLTRGARVSEDHRARLWYG